MLSQAGSVSEPFGQGWSQVAEFAIAFVLSSAIGLEREIRQKAAGLRTYTVVGIGSALFTLISKYGWTDVLHEGMIVADPSRMAAQIVSGLGFIGGGVIFVQRGSVRGITTAAAIWLTAAVGSAAAAGLPLLALTATLAYFALGYVIRPLAGRLPALRNRGIGLRITYIQGQGLMRELVNQCVQFGFALTELSTVSERTDRSSRRRITHRSQDGENGEERRDEDEDDGVEERTIEVEMTVQGRGDVDGLVARLAEISGVLACNRTDLGDE
ncbi:MgtC/SapB family protein [Phaeacidiphilus oryzae]|uniref:MgtC/SapB family protein n=1 Tax=Phaeacidiphilus oryzae TaxID=348818 RepID=UPI0005692B1E|nr:MgtC/SapB family protein [Phaeacidiphilus oryzae]